MVAMLYSRGKDEEQKYRNHVRELSEVGELSYINLMHYINKRLMTIATQEEFEIELPKTMEPQELAYLYTLYVKKYMEQNLPERYYQQLRVGLIPRDTMDGTAKIKLRVGKDKQGKPYTSRPNECEYEEYALSQRKVESITLGTRRHYYMETLNAIRRELERAICFVKGKQYGDTSTCFQQHLETKGITLK